MPKIKTDDDTPFFEALVKELDDCPKRRADCKQCVALKKCLRCWDIIAAEKNITLKLFLRFVYQLRAITFS